MFEIPLSRSMHVASRCAIKCYHCMRPISLLIPRTASFMTSTSRCLPSDLPPSYTLDFRNSTERSLMDSILVTEWNTPSVRFFHSIFFHTLSKIPLPLCRNVEVLRHVATFILVLQEAHPLNTEVIHFSENFCKTEL